MFLIKLPRAPEIPFFASGESKIFASSKDPGDSFFARVAGSNTFERSGVESGSRPMPADLELTYSIAFLMFAASAA